MLLRLKRWSKPCNALCLRLVGSQASAILRPQWTCWNAQKLQSKQLEQLGACMTAEKMTWQGHIGDIPRSNMKGIDKCIATVEVSCGIGRCYLVCPYHWFSPDNNRRRTQTSGSGPFLTVLLESQSKAITLWTMSKKLQESQNNVPLFPGKGLLDGTRIESYQFGKW